MNAKQRRVRRRRVMREAIWGRSPMQKVFDFHGDLLRMPVVYGSSPGLSQAVAQRQVRFLPPQYDKISVTREQLEATRHTPFSFEKVGDQ